MKKLISFIAAFVLVGASATSVLAIPCPCDGSSVDIFEAQFKFNNSTKVFQTAVGSDHVTAVFNDPFATPTASFADAKLVVSPVDFSSGFALGKLGTFSITDNGTGFLLLSGTFGVSPGDSTLGPGKFETSFITSFVNYGLVGTSYFAPGQFVALLPGISALKSSWTTTEHATATIASTVPEPASLMLLGAGLAGIGIWRRKSTKI